MRISDWSSDVCSSDLRLDVADGLKAAGLARTLADEAIDVLINNAGVYGPRSGFGATDYDAWAEVLQVNTLAPLRMVERWLGRASCRERVCQYVSISVGAVSLKKK